MNTLLLERPMTRDQFLDIAEAVMSMGFIVTFDQGELTHRGVTIGYRYGDGVLRVELLKLSGLARLASKDRIKHEITELLGGLKV